MAIKGIFIVITTSVIIIAAVSYFTSGEINPTDFVLFPFIAVLISFIYAFISLNLSQQIHGTEKEIDGIVRMVGKRSEAYGIKYRINKQASTQSVFNLKIEQTDKEGNIINVMPVEMRGCFLLYCHQIIGDIVDGDRVRVQRKVADGLMRTKEIINITTNSIVKVK